MAEQKDDLELVMTVAVSIGPVVRNGASVKTHVVMEVRDPSGKREPISRECGLEWTAVDCGPGVAVAPSLVLWDNVPLNVVFLRQVLGAEMAMRYSKLLSEAAVNVDHPGGECDCNTGSEVCNG